ncbi:MAG: hypothetical protein AAFN27_13645 [Pseudomonadota bacterium]
MAEVTKQRGSVQAFSLDRLEQACRSVLSGQRICQLYCFMLLFEWLTKPFGAFLSYATYGFTLLLARFSEVEPGAAPVIDWLQTSRNVVEFLTIGVVWVVYLIWSDYRRSYTALALCMFALGYNLYIAYGAFMVKGPGLDNTVNGIDMSFELAFFSTVFMVGLVLSHMFFLHIAIRGQRTIHALAESERRTLSEYRSGAGVIFSSMKGLVNIPAAIRYSSRKLVTGVLMMIAGVANCVNYWRLFMVSLFVCLLPYMFSSMFPAGRAALTAIWHGEHLAEAFWVLTIGVAGILIALLLLMSIPWFVKITGRIAIRAARTFMRTSLQKIQHQDARAPVLFLRSFLNDQVALQTKEFSLERWLLDGASQGMTLDYLVLGEGTTVGPTVALGNPDDPAPPYGVARGYFTHDTWQQAVGRLCEDSVAIVMVLDTTEGVKWEIGHIVQKNYLPKTLFLLAPEDVGTVHGIAMLADALSRITKTPLVEVKARLTDPGQKCALGFTVPDPGQAELLTSGTSSLYAYIVAVRRFFRGLKLDEASDG